MQTDLFNFQAVGDDPVPTKSKETKTRKTSIDCYNEIKAKGLLSKRRFEVYEAILKNAPCTTNEALKDVFSGSHGVGSRTTELRELGVIYEKGVRKCKVTGRNVIEWDLTDKLPKNMVSFKKTKKERVKSALIALSDLYEKKDTSTADDWKSVFELINEI